MYELSCPACNSASQYDIQDHLLMCPFCSATYSLDMETGQKDVFGDHYIVANTSNAAQLKSLVTEWLKRLDHRPGSSEKEYFITNIRGLSIPFWVVSMEAHTAWKGLVQKQNRSRAETGPGTDYLIETGQYKRNYRWAVSSRGNICETWGISRLHEPKENIQVQWDGFPLDSTFSRGQIQETQNSKSAYDSREFFEFKFANGLPIMGIQIHDEEALRRSRMHVEQYHLALTRLNVDYLIDCRTEIEVAGLQLIHLPFWYASYIYRPKSVLRHFYRPKEKNVIIEGFNNGVLAGELPIQHKDKLWVNSIVCGIATMIFLLMGLAWHPAMFLVALFGGMVTAASAYSAATKADLISKQNEMGASESARAAG